MTDGRLPHERLRELDEGLCTGEMLARIIGCEPTKCMNTPCSECVSNLLNELADEIERDYIPREQHEREMKELSEAQSMSARHIMKSWAECHGMTWEKGETITRWLDRNYIQMPCDANGMPWRIGDPCEGEHYAYGAVAGYILRQNSKEWQIFVEFPEETESFPASTLERPQPKVLDADGVEIKVGDTVWSKSGGKMEVAAIFDDGGISVNYDTKAIGIVNSNWFKPSDVTHKEPDSLEKLLDDMTKFGINTYFASLEVREPFEGFLNRLASLIERGA